MNVPKEVRSRDGESQQGATESNWLLVANFTDLPQKRFYGVTLTSSTPEKQTSKSWGYPRRKRKTPGYIFP